jgi:hypothetical protein
MIFRGISEFSKYFCLRDFEVFYSQKSVGPIGPMPQGRGLILKIKYQWFNGN